MKNSKELRQRYRDQLENLVPLSRMERMAVDHRRAPNTVLQEIRKSGKARTHAITVRRVSEVKRDSDGEPILDQCGRVQYRQRAEIIEAAPRRQGGGSPMHRIRAREAAKAISEHVEGDQE